jgi:hypothetical protein
MVNWRARYFAPNVLTFAGRRAAIQADAHAYVAGSVAPFWFGGRPGMDISAWAYSRPRMRSVSMAHPVHVMRIEPAVRVAPVRVSEPPGEPGVPRGVAMFAVVGDSPYRDDYQHHHTRS